MNAGLLVDLPQLDESGAERHRPVPHRVAVHGRRDLPACRAGNALPLHVSKPAGNRPVTFRSLDIGGDKVVPYFRSPRRRKIPALGWRAIRLSLDRPGLFRTQIRALLKASLRGELRSCCR
jgi:phosphotransferase system enzyme I (PtsP)